MDSEKFEIVPLPGDLTEGKIEGYDKVCRYLLQKICEGCEGYESFGLSEGFYGGTGREGIFYTSTEDGMCE